MIRISAPAFVGSNNRKDILAALLRRRQADLAGKAVLDGPTSNGDTAQLLKELGAEVASDLYPEFFRCPDSNCVPANLNGPLPFADASFDYVICQESIEHMPGVYAELTQLNRSLAVLAGSRRIVEYAPRQEASAAVATLAGKLTLEMART